LPRSSGSGSVAIRHHPLVQNHIHIMTISKINYAKIAFSVFAIAAVIFCFGFVITEPALAVNTGLETTAQQAGLSSGDSGEGDENIAVIAGTIINSLLGLIGIVFLALVIYGGFLWMTARGNADQVKKAQTMMVQATIGTIIIFAAYSIVDFLFNNVIGI